MKAKYLIYNNRNAQLSATYVTTTKNCEVMLDMILSQCYNVHKIYRVVNGEKTLIYGTTRTNTKKEKLPF